jgi:hypothetical protein
VDTQKVSCVVAAVGGIDALRRGNLFRVLHRRHSDGTFIGYKYNRIVHFFVVMGQHLSVRSLPLVGVPQSRWIIAVRTRQVPLDPSRQPSHSLF